MPQPKTVLAKELRTIKSSFTQLARAFERIAPLVMPAAGTPNPALMQIQTRRRPRLTAQRKAALKLQGRYMGMMRGMRPAGRARLKKIRADKGIEAAIAAAERMSSEA